MDAATPPFHQDTTCSNALIAAQKPGCMGEFADFGNRYLNRIFTAFFGMVGKWMRLPYSLAVLIGVDAALDVVVLLGVAVLLKDRIEKERFRFSDMKSGLRGI